MIPSEYVNQTSIVSQVSRNISQFAYPNTLNWNLNISFAFEALPSDVCDCLIGNAFVSEGITYYNVTLFEELLEEHALLEIPQHGYLLMFIWIPDNATVHSWFYTCERPDLFLNRTDYFNGIPINYWVFPSNFGGTRRALYFDISDTMEQAPTESKVTNTIIKLLNNSLSETFPNLLGATDSRMIEADAQKYKNYAVKILWLNGTGQPLPLGRIEEGLEDLMPWTDWTITIEARLMDSELNELITSRTVTLPSPTAYSFLLSNGTSMTIQAHKNVLWDVLHNYGENDPLNCYLFDHVEEYFNITDLGDKSMIPVVFLQLDNDTVLGGAVQGGLSKFTHNIVIVGFHGGMVTDLGESGPFLLAHLLEHEIGHWISISHHTSSYGSDYPKIICSMRSITNKFCAFCKDARARMSFVSYYKAIVELLAKNETLSEIYNASIHDALLSFYTWDYVDALESIVSIYYAIDNKPPIISCVSQEPSQDNVSPKDKVIVNCTVVDDLSGVRRVALRYILRNGTWHEIAMSNLEGSIWNGEIPAFPYGTNVTYIVSATDNVGNTVTTEQLLGHKYGYQVIPEFSLSTVLIVFIMTTLLSVIITKEEKNNGRHNCCIYSISYGRDF